MAFLYRILTVLTCVCGFGTAWAQVADYRDAAEMDAAIRALDGELDGRAQVDAIGRTEEGRDILAITLNSTPRNPGRVRLTKNRPVFLVECAMHAREWAAAETCMTMVEDYIALYKVAPLLTSAMPTSIYANLEDVIRDVEIIVIPMVNPDGRAFDDQNGGDPYQYGSGIGWRKNRGVYPACDNGIDLARNYSRGWDGADASRTCTDRKYRGAYPFEAKENRRLRRLVNNRLVAMALSVHGNGQGFDWLVQPTGSSFSGLNSYYASTYVDEFNRAHNGQVELIIGNGPSGGGHGQFPAWATQTSNNPNSGDEGSLRAISSFMLELPIWNYSGSSYELPSSNTSHGFRPTSAQFLEDMRAPMLAGFLYLARQAANTWREYDPIADGPATVACTGALCPRDMALVGSTLQRRAGVFSPRSTEGDFRIAAGPDVHDFVEPGRYRPLVAVQNASLSAGDMTRNVRFELERFSGPTTGWVTILVNSGSANREVTADAGEIKYIKGPTYDLTNGNEYRLTIEIDGADRQPINDRNVFRFRVHN